MTTVIVSKKHIDIIVTAYYFYEAEADLIFGPRRNKDFNKVGQILWGANYKSSINEAKLQLPEYNFNYSAATLCQIYKAIEALDHQSRGTLSYRKSEAKKILIGLKELIGYKIISSLREYRDAEWLIK
jgi:hypothetical protein